MYKNIAHYVYVLLASGIIVLAIIGVGSNYYLQKASIEYNAKIKLDSFYKRFDSYIDQEASMMENFLLFIKEKHDIQTLFIDSNKKKLFIDAKPIFNELNKKNDITHFYLIKPDGKVLLRVHDFERDADIIKRYTFLKAKEKQTNFYGIEFGLKKNYTLRVVSPWNVDGHLIGYVELGKEVDKISKILSNELGIQIFYAVNKTEYKNSADFIIKRLSKDMQTKNYYIVYQTIPSNQKIIDFMDNYKKPRWIEIDGKHYIGFIDTLKDVSQKKLGQKLFMVDVTQDYGVLQKSVVYYATIMFFGTIMMLLIGYLFTRKKQLELNIALEEVERKNQERKNLLSLFDRGDSVLFRWNNDSEWSIDYVSSNIQNLLGYSTESFINKEVKYVDCICGDDLPNVLKEVEIGVTNENGFFKHEPYRVVTKDGDIKWVLDYTVLDKNIDGITTHFLGYVIDITERQELYKNLEKFIANQDNIVILTNGKEINFANNKFFSFLGFQDINQFKSAHQCICEFFIANDRFFHLAKIKDDENWIEVIDTLPQSNRIVSMLGYDFVPHAFSVTINKFDQNLVIVSFNDITQTVLEKIKLEEKTIHDKLTGAFNREFFEQNYKQLMNQYSQSNHLFGLAILDIDYFKKVNDTYGHDVGDEVLVSFVKTIQKHSRVDDILIRWGGEEFVIIVKVKSEDDLHKALEHLRKVIEIAIFPVVGHKTCSIGGTIYKDNEEIKKTIKRADEAVYEAKINGRNQVVIIL